MTLSPEIDYWASEELRPEVIRGPEVTTIIKEITNSVVIHERVIEKQIITTVPTPTTNANTVIITTPGGDTTSGNSTPVLNSNTVVVIPPVPVDPPKPPPPPEPVIPPIYNWQEWGGFGGWTGYDLGQFAYAGWIGSSAWVPTVDLAMVPYNAGQTMVTPLPATATQVYDTPITAGSGTGGVSLSDGTYNNYYDMLAYYAGTF